MTASSAVIGWLDKILPGARTHPVTKTGNEDDSMATVTSLDEKGVAGSGIYTRFYWEQLIGTTYATIEVKVTWSDEGVSDSAYDGHTENW